MLLLLQRMLLKIAIYPRKLLTMLLSSLIAFILGIFLFTTSQHLRSSTYWHQMSGSSQQKEINENMLLVGVMTAKHYLDTRALEIWQTWARHIPGQVIFFVAEHTQISQRVHLSQMPIVRLRGVNDAYPPQKKSFAMIRWMFDNQLDKFHWFMRADDDLYVRGDKLKDFLLSLDPDKAHLIGQAGLGNSLEYGQLLLGYKDNYCMGGPGVIFSRETLRQLAPHLELCLSQLLTTHEDVELGRCIRQHVGLACPWNYEMQTLFHNNATVASIYSDQTPIFRDSFLPLRHFITLHPVKNPEAMRRIHFQAKILRLNKMRQKRMELMEELEGIDREIGGGIENGDARMGRAEMMGLQAQQQRRSQNGGPRLSGLIPLQPNTTNDVPIWEFISTNSKILFCTQRPNCPRHTLETGWRYALSTAITELFDQFNADARQRGRTLHFQSLQYGYVRLQPQFGVDMVLDIALWYRRFRGPHPAQLTARRHVYLQQRLGQLRSRIVGIKTIGSAATIHIIVALKGRSKTFTRFAQNLMDLSREDDGQIKLVLVHYASSDTAEDILINNTITSLLQQKILLQLVKMPIEREFSRGEALSLGAALLPADSLVFFSDVDVLMRRDTLHRIRLNTIKNKQVYFPIVFSEFAPSTWHSSNNKQNGNMLTIDDHFVYDLRRGYFRHFGFGIVSIYRSDFDTVGGFNMTIQGWGLEDVDFFERIIKTTQKLELFRAPDPGLVHVFHPIDCTSKGSHQQSKAQKEACEGTRAHSLASLDFLAEQIGPYL